MVQTRRSNKRLRSSRKKNGFVLSILTAAAGQNSRDPYSKIFMHVAAADCAVF